MLSRVLGHVAFGRAPRRTVNVVLFVLTLGASLAAAASLAAGPTAPGMSLAQTRDLDGDGFLDAIVVTFDSPMKAASAPTGFTVEGYDLGAPATAWLNAQGGTATQLQINVVERTSTGGDTAATPKVFYAAGTSSPAESATGTPMMASNKTPTDLAGPVLMRATAKDFAPFNTFNSLRDEMRFYFSEPVQLSGATAQDRVKALDLAIKFSAITTCGHPNTADNPDDANATNFASGKSNFPIPSAAQGALDPIVEPAAGAKSSVIRVQMRNTTTASTITNVAVHGFCGVGIDPNGTGNITDGVSPTPNSAVSQDVGSTARYRRDIDEADTSVSFVDEPMTIPAIYSQDLVPANGDGYVDAVRITFEQDLKDDTITNALASKLTIRAGSVTAQVTGVDTGATPDDQSLVVRLAGTSSWGGGVKPTVAFDNSGCLLKSKVPTQGYFACVESFGQQVPYPSLDGVPPAVVSAITADSNANGFIDRVSVILTESVAPGATKDGWTINNLPAGDLAVAGSSITLSFIEDASLHSGVEPSVRYNPQTGNTTDAAGAELKDQTFTALDAAAPRAVKATTLATSPDGKTDRVTIEMSEPVADASLVAALLKANAADALGFASSSIDASPVANDKLVTVRVDQSGTAAFGIEYDGAIADLKGNINPSGFSFAAAEVTDRAAPVVVELSTTPAGSVGSNATVAAKLSEALDGNVAPAAAVGGKAVSPVADGDHNANGFRTADASRWDGTIVFDATDCAAQNGCVKQVTFTGVKDLAGNTSIAATPIEVVVDAVAPDKATAEKSAALQSAGFGAIDDNTIGGNTANLRITASIAAGQVNSLGQSSGGKAEVLVDGEPVGASVQDIAANAGSVTIDTAFASPSALQAAIPEGAHTIAIRLCDSALNCSTSDGVAVTADYSPVPVTLVAPQGGGSYVGGDHVCIQWDGDDTANGFVSTELRYSTDGGATFPHVIATGLPLDGALACGVEGGGYDWTLPALNTTGLRVQARTIDAFANAGTAASATSSTVETITQTALAIAANPSVGSVVYGGNATITGTLTGNGAGVAGKQVQILARNVGSSAFTAIATLTTNADGQFTHTFKPGMRADYKAVFARSGPYLASESVVKHVSVAVNVTSWASASRLRPGQTVTFRGSVLPNQAGKFVWLQAYLGGKWQTVAKQYLPSNSSYSLSYRSTSKRTLLFRVAFPTQSNTYAWNISQRYWVTWS